MENNPLNNLPPEARQRLEDALRSGRSSNLSPEARQRLEDALRGGSVQNVFVSQYSDTLSQEPGAYAEGSAAGAFGDGAFPDMRQLFGNNIINMPAEQTKHNQEAWAHWEYSPNEWAHFDRVDWVPVRNRSWLTLTLIAVLWIGIVAVLWTRFALSAPGPLLFVNGLLLSLSLGPIIVAFTSTREAKKRHQARRQPGQPRRVTFSREGIWESGTYLTFWRLLKVKMTANPPVLHFTLAKPNGRSYDTQKIHVLVPRNYEAEAQRLLQRFDDEVINARNKALNRPEPI
jgi:hypothetical protein